MAIEKKKREAAAFIAAAPDGVRTVRTRGKKSVISMTVAPDVLLRMDARAVEQGVSRASIVAIAFAYWDKRETEVAR